MIFLCRLRQPDQVVFLENLTDSSRLASSQKNDRYIVKMEIIYFNENDNHKDKISVLNFLPESKKIKNILYSRVESCSRWNGRFEMYRRYYEHFQS